MLTVKVVKVKSVRKIKKQDIVCDITVANNHNLFACDKITNFPVLVHNCVDENMKSMSNVTGDYYYSLGNLSTQYGYEGYLTANFGKEDRYNILNTDLDDDLLKYCLSGKNFVLTPNGYVPIADIQIGDIVVSYNHTTSKTELQPVVDTSKHHTNEAMFEICTEDGSTIMLTENHEVWSVTRNAYIKVCELFENEDVLLEDKFSNLTYG